MGRTMTELPRTSTERASLSQVTGLWVSKVVELLTTAGLKAKLDDDRIRPGEPRLRARGHGGRC